MARDKDYCWKCDNYLHQLHSFTGLCGDCRDSLFGIAGAITAVVVFVFGYNFYIFRGTVTPVFADRVISGMLTDLLALILLGTGYVLYRFVKWIWTSLQEWFAAIWQLISDILEERREEVLEEAKQRALEASPKLLNGQELDALLTQEYMEKQGWQ